MFDATVDLMYPLNLSGDLSLRAGHFRKCPARSPRLLRGYDLIIAALAYHRDYASTAIASVSCSLGNTGSSRANTAKSAAPKVNSATVMLISISDGM